MPVAPYIKELMTSKNSSAIRRMFEEGSLLKQKYGEYNVYDFSIGNPDLEPPPGVLEAIKAVASDTAKGSHGYMPNAGYLEARTAMAEKISREQGIPVAAGCVVMSVGAAAALNCVFKSIISPGDEIIVPAPYFAEYNHYVKNHGGVLIAVRTHDDFSLDIKAIADALTDRTAAVLINSPNNPTGKIYSADELAQLAAALSAHAQNCGRQPYIVCDEPYRDITYDGRSVAPVFPVYNAAVIVSSFAKNISLPGERIGYICVNPGCPDKDELVAACIFATRTLGFVNAPAFFQRVVARAWNTPVDFSSYYSRCRQLMSIFNDAGIEYAVPEGAFYIFCKVPPRRNLPVNPEPDTLDNIFCDYLKQFRILCAPGTGFGCSGWFRTAYCIPDVVIKNSRDAWIQAVSEW